MGTSKYVDTLKEAAILCFVNLIREDRFMDCNVNMSIEMGGTCCTYGGRERCAQGFGGEN